jgi:hypothetical protein
MAPPFMSAKCMQLKDVMMSGAWQEPSCRSRFKTAWPASLVGRAVLGTHSMARSHSPLSMMTTTLHSCLAAATAKLIKKRCLPCRSCLNLELDLDISWILDLNFGSKKWTIQYPLDIYDMIDSCTTQRSPYVAAACMQGRSSP